MDINQKIKKNIRVGIEACGENEGGLDDCFVKNLENDLCRQHRIYPVRLLIVVISLCVLALALYFLKYYSWSPFFCVFKRFGGFYCAGCGMTRAIESLLWFEFTKAFHYNPLGVFFFPFAFVKIALDTIAWVRGLDPLWKNPTGKYGYLIFTALVILYTILRNLPWAPFNLLAPTSDL